MAACIFQSQRLDPQLHYFAVSRLVAAGITREPKRFRRGDAGFGDARFPQCFGGANMCAAEQPREKCRSEVKSAEIHRRQFLIARLLTQAEKRLSRVARYL